MSFLTRAAWSLGNWLAQIVFAFRFGYRDGEALHPAARPKILKEE